MTSEFLFDKKYFNNTQLLFNTKPPSLHDISISNTDIPLKYYPDIPIPLSFQIHPIKKLFTFTLLILILCASSMDFGIISASINTIKDDLHINNKQLGYFGSFEYIGHIIGTIVIYSVINKINRKMLLISAVVFKAFALCINAFTNVYMILLIGRCFAGISHIFFLIYFPIWVEQYGIKEKKGIMFALIQIGLSFGIGVGFVLCTLLNKKWVLSLYIQHLILCGIALCLVFVPKMYFTMNDNNNNNSSNNESSSKHSKFIQQSGINIKDHSLLVNIISLLKEPIFVLTTLSNSVDLLSIGAVHFWGIHFIENVLQIENPTTLIISFILLFFTSPSLSVLVFSIINKRIKGYETQTFMIFCTTFTLLTSICGSPCGYAKTLIVYCMFVWLFMFLMKIVISLKQIIAVKSVPVELKEDATLIMEFVINVFGKFPAALSYGLVSSAYGYRKAMKVCSNCSYVGVVLIGVASVMKKNEKGENLHSLRDTMISCSTTSSGSTSSSVEDLELIEDRASLRTSYANSQI